VATAPAKRTLPESFINLREDGVMIESTRFRNKQLAFLIQIILLACTACTSEGDDTAKVTPSVTSRATSHATTPSEQPDVGDSTLTAEATPTPNQPAHTRKPTNTPTPIPIPDQLYLPYQTVGAWWPGTALDAIHDGQLFHDFPTPVIGTVLWGYTGLTGRLAYGKMFLTETGESDLWVYDYKTDENQQWLLENVTFALWAPLINAKLGFQPLAILNTNEALALVTGPNQTRILTKNACCISWSQAADAIAFIRDGALYTFSLEDNQERKITEGLSIDSQIHLDWPVWAQEHGAIIYQDHPIRIAPLNGSAAFEPQFPDGGKLEAKNAHTILWSPEKRLLVFEEHGMQVSSGHPCDRPDNNFGRIWVVELSKDLHTITDAFYIPDMGLYLNNWVKSGESVRMSWDLMDIMVYSDTVSTDEIEAVVERYGGDGYTADAFLLPNYAYPGYTFLWFEEETNGFRKAAITDRTNIYDLQGNPIHFSDLSPGMKVLVTYREVLEEALADEIRVLDL
jgi:hypothetical protein